jgi:hypothetical protein
MSLSRGNGSHGEYLLHLPNHQVIICRPCKHALVPGGKSVERHLRKWHKTMEVQDRRELVRYCQGLPLAIPKRVMAPVQDSQPIQGLALFDGQMCGPCGYVCRSERNMQEHCRGEHRWIKEQGTMWTRHKVQTFFDGPNRKYFVVTPRSEEGEEAASTHSLDQLIVGLSTMPPAKTSS